MKTATIPIEDRVDSHTKEIGGFGYCLDENDENFGSYKAVEDMSDDELEIVAKRLNVSADFLKDSDVNFRELRNAVHKDLADIWEQIGGNF